MTDPQPAAPGSVALRALDDLWRYTVAIIIMLVWIAFDTAAVLGQRAWRAARMR